MLCQKQCISEERRRASASIRLQRENVTRVMEEVRCDASKANRIISLALSGKIPLQDIASGRIVSARMNRPKKKRGMLPFPSFLPPSHLLSHLFCFRYFILNIAVQLSLSDTLSHFLSFSLSLSIPLSRSPSLSHSLQCTRLFLFLYLHILFSFIFVSLFLQASKVPKSSLLSDIIGIDPDTVRPKSAGGKPECISDDFDDERPSDDGKCNCISDRKGGREVGRWEGR